MLNSNRVVNIYFRNCRFGIRIQLLHGIFQGTKVVPQSVRSHTDSAQTKVAQQYDLERTLYYQSFLREMLKSIYEDGVNVVGALAWSLQ